MKNYIDRKQIVVAWGVFFFLQMGIRKLFGVIEFYQNWIVVMIAQLCKFTKNYQTMYFNWVNFAIFKLFLSKTIKNNLKEIAEKQ